MRAPRTEVSGARALRTAGLGLALAGTLGLGVVMRWFLAGSGWLPGDLGNLRHAHSHLGYFGLLFPLAWLAWRRAGAPAPGFGWMVAYALATAVAIAGFVRAGYGPEAIVGSTVVGAVWLVSAWRLRSRMRSAWGWLGGIPLAIVAAEACIPPIAIMLRRDPVLAQGFVRSFLAMLLLGAIAPSALLALGARPPPWTAWLVAAALASAYLGVWPSPISGVGLVALGILIGGAVLRSRAPWDLVGSWLVLAASVAVMGTGLVINERLVAIAAIHFLILSPALVSLALPVLRRPPGIGLRLPYHGLVAAMSGALLMQSYGAAGAVRWAAIAGTAIAAWWLGVILLQVPAWARGA